MTFEEYVRSHIDPWPSQRSMMQVLDTLGDRASVAFSGSPRGGATTIGQLYARWRQERNQGLRIGYATCGVGPSSAQRVGTSVVPLTFGEPDLPKLDLLIIDNPKKTLAPITLAEARSWCGEGPQVVAFYSSIEFGRA